MGEAITNILAADVRDSTDIRLSANWMAACGEPGEDADLYATVRAVGAELCTSLGHHHPGRQGLVVDDRRRGR